MSIPLLSTKLFIPPPRPGLVARLRLLDKLNAGLRAGQRLILIAAPAGFGKTTLLSAWIDQITACASPPRAAWLQLDPGDDDRVRFMRYLIAALQTIDARWGQTAQAMLQAPLSADGDQALAAALAALINDLAAQPQQSVVVLDDYHLIQSRPVHDALTFLLDHVPPIIQFVVAGRADPPLPLARLRATGQLTEIRAVDLRFTPDESAIFLNETMQLDLTRDQIAALDQQAEGWIAGLHLAALALQGTLSRQGRRDFNAFLESFSGRNRYVLDYLIEEVLSRQADDVQDFLLRTSILDRLTGSVCEALTDRPHGETRLAALEQANLFIEPLDQDRTWYRYHPLFAEFLRSRLQQRLSVSTVLELHRRASGWYTQHGLWHEAIAHALRAQDYDHAAALIEQIARETWIMRGESGTLLAWISALPQAIVIARPRLRTIHAWALMADGQREAAAACAQQVIDTTPPDQTELIGEAEAISAIITALHSNVPRTIELAQRALEHLPASDHFLRGLVALQLGLAYDTAGNLSAAGRVYTEATVIGRTANLPFISLMAAIQLADLKVVQGQLHEAAAAYQHAGQLGAEPDQQLPIVSMAYSSLGRVWYEWNDLDRATQYLQESISWGQRWAANDIRSTGLIYLAYVQLAQGQTAAAYDLLQQADRALHQRIVSPLSVDVARMHQARLALRLNDLPVALAWAEDYQARLPELPATLRVSGAATLARIWLVQGQAAGVCELIGPRATTLEAGGLIGSALEFHMLHALALHQLDRPEEARTVFTRALTLAEPGGYVRLFVDEGEPMRFLILDCRLRIEKSSAQLHSYIDRLLTAFPAAQESAVQLQPSALSPQPLIEPLSDRELEVLRLIAEGYANQEIAQRLVVALSTVKTHINNIYGKLAVQSRTQAVARARTLGLLP
ncbi:HTH-type transcriptional regulator MalT [Thermoflexales bacterium]|nr:HTH-type transcriptional regulator MalT [Thermoflexales bacterium]